MSDLQNQTPADTYKGLLQVGDYTDGITNYTGATALQVTDGAGVNTALALSTTRVGVGNNSPQAELDVSGGIEATTLTTSGAVTAGSVSTSGDVGIGTDSPSSKLEIVDSSDHLNLKVPNTFSQSVIKFSDSDGLGGAINYDHNTDKLHFITDGTATPANGALNINSSGNVGIGTDSPNAKLQIDAHDNSTNALALWIRDVNKTNSIISAYENGNVRLGSFWYDDASGNVGLGNVTTFGANATNTIAIKEGVEPTNSPNNLVQLFCTEVSEIAELRVRNEEGIVTTLSPHAKDAPSSLYDRPPGEEEMHRSANHYLGTITFTNVDRRNDLLQKQLNGEELPEDRTFTVTETFEEYNARTGADLQVEDWEANQQVMADADESYVKKPKPDWLT